ncbi:hypothetical protein BDA96_08G139200 [Sorghum bicolor]|uniref:Uncharacterized protein n=1 Tax=Sorghum bicolor TaxID=4558 RepID=A0A921QI19_SORBI|nr:hypothetical protein BDA96_08G139200 [Sorghum bicolor]
MPKGTPIGVAAKKKGAAPSATGCIVKQKAPAATNGGQPPLSPTSPTAAAQKVQNHHPQYSLGNLESFQEQIEGLRHEVTQLSHLCSNRHADQQIRLEANQEHIAANGSKNMRLCFLNGLEPPVYTDENLTSQNHAAIKVAMLEGDKVVTSGALSEAKIEILVLRGDFSNKCQDNWTEDEFDKHVMQGRDGHDLVLGTVWLTNGMVELSQIRFREGSCRKNVIMAARVCKSEKTSGRVQEAIMKPVKVLDRRNKPNEKSHPPRLDDRLYRLEGIARDGVYHKRLQKVQIHNVEGFLKALNEDSNKLRAILKMENQQNAWSKLTGHARQCVLEYRQELKRYHSKEGNVVLFFNCVHELVGAAFPHEYVACQRFNTAQKALVNKWRLHAYEKLEDISPDFVMKDQGIQLHGQHQVISPWPRSPQSMMDFDSPIELAGMNCDLYQDPGASISAQSQLMF